MHVVFHCRDRDDELRGDLLVAESGGDELRDVSLACRQVVEHVRSARLRLVHDGDGRFAMQHGHWPSRRGRDPDDDLARHPAAVLAGQCGCRVAHGGYGRVVQIRLFTSGHR